MEGYCKKWWFVLLLSWISVSAFSYEVFPDGTPISDWFKESRVVSVETLGRKYCVTDYGVKNDSTLLQTEAIQQVIDKAAEEGGGVVYIPEGTFLSGSLFSNRIRIFTWKRGLP